MVKTQGQELLNQMVNNATSAVESLCTQYPSLRDKPVASGNRKARDAVKSTKAELQKVINSESKAKSLVNKYSEDKEAMEIHVRSLEEQIARTDELRSEAVTKLADLTRTREQLSKALSREIRDDGEDTDEAEESDDDEYGEAEDALDNSHAGRVDWNEDHRPAITRNWFDQIIKGAPGGAVMDIGLQGQLQTWMDANEFTVPAGTETGRVLPGHQRGSPYEDDKRQPKTKNGAGPRSIISDEVA